MKPSRAAISHAKTGILSGWSVLALASLGCAAMPAALAAQEVVQQLPNPATEVLGEAMRQLSRNPETQSIPVIMCTTKGQETDRVWGMRQGAIDYLVKPVVAEELIAKVKALD